MWISNNLEQQPDDNESILVYNTLTREVAFGYKRYDLLFNHKGSVLYSFEFVTHWMYLESPEKICSVCGMDVEEFSVFHNVCENRVRGY